jgi:hypothetical protein
VAESFEYAIRKDVRNNPIVREVDEARQRELWKTVALIVGLVIAALFSAWPHMELMVNGYRIEQLQREKDAEEEMTRQLRLEIETLRSRQTHRIARHQPPPSRGAQAGRGHRARTRRPRRTPRLVDRRQAVRVYTP